MKKFTLFKRITAIIGVITLVAGFIPMNPLSQVSAVYAADPTPIPGSSGPVDQTVVDPETDLGLPDAGVNGFHNDECAASGTCEKTSVDVSDGGTFDFDGSVDPNIIDPDTSKVIGSPEVIVVKAGTSEFVIARDAPFFKICDPAVDAYCAKWWDDGTVTVQRFGESRDRKDISHVEFWDLESDENSVLGCTDALAVNYDASATVDNGTCEFPPEEIPGCTDPLAANYDAIATVDNGTCEFPPEETPGCTNPLAANYNAEATTDNGTCEYDPGDPTDPQPNPPVSQPPVGTTGTASVLIPVTGVYFPAQTLLRQLGFGILGLTLLLESSEKFNKKK